MFALLSSLTCSHTRTMVAGMPRALSTCSTTASVPLSRARTACQTNTCEQDIRLHRMCACSPLGFEPGR